MKHVHSELIKLWADGAEVEYLYEINGCARGWFSISNPAWEKDVKYRIKPTPKPDQVRYLYAGITRAGDIYDYPDHYSNLKLTFDGETGKLKAAEVI